MATKLEAPIQPKLFDDVKAYAGEISAGHIDPAKPLKRTAPIIIFCTNLYLQFFQNVVKQEIVTIDEESKQVAARAAITLEKSGHGTPEVLALIAWFEELCDIFPDVLGLSYGGSRGFFVHFHTSYVARLLDRSDAWAKTTDHGELRAATAEARSVYRAAVLGL